RRAGIGLDGEVSAPDRLQGALAIDLEIATVPGEGLGDAAVQRQGRGVGVEREAAADDDAADEVLAGIDRHRPAVTAADAAVAVDARGDADVVAGEEIEDAAAAAAD